MNFHGIETWSLHYNILMNIFILIFSFEHLNGF